MKITQLASLLAFSMFLSSCEKDEETPDDFSSTELKVEAPVFMELKNNSFSISGFGIADKTKTTENGELQVALYLAEYITAGETEHLGNTVYFKNTGNRQLGADFVPGLSIDGKNAISYYVDDSRTSADLDTQTANEAIDRAMTTWAEVDCSEPGIFEIPYTEGVPTGFYAQFLTDISGIDFGGSNQYVADLVHAGWQPAEFFDFLAENGSDFILGVTFTITYVDANGDPLDSNNDGKADVAFREIYYNDNFTWNDGTTYDVETIALHEAGHGLSQAHFGKAFITESNSKVHFAPRAVMNAAYSGVQNDIENTDKAGHCSNWSSWPTN